METRTNWGMIVFGGLFAIVAIGVAATTYFFESKNTTTPTVVAVEPNIMHLPDVDNDGIPDWQEKLIGTNPNSADSDGNGVSDAQELALGTYTANRTSSPTASLTNDIVNQYEELKKNNTLTPAEFNVAAKKIVDSNVSIPDISEKISLSDLHIIATSSVNTYAQLLLIILRQSTQIKEYELTTFRRTVDAKNYGGTTALRTDAVLYKDIEDALIKIDVPSQVAPDHLVVVNAIGALANIVTLMSVWDGDPLTGIVYVDTFSKAETDVTNAISALLQRTASLAKKV